MSTVGKLQAKLAELLQINEAMVTHIESLVAERDYFKNGMAELQDIIDKLEPERDALVAQVSRMSTFIKLSAAKWENCNDVYPTFWSLLRVAKETPQHHLAEIRAEAGRAGYYEGFRAGIVIDAPLLPPQSGASAIDHFRRMVDHAARVNADNYAATVRQGGAE